MSRLLRHDVADASGTLSASKVIVLASVAMLRCREAIDAKDRRAALTQVADLRDALRVRHAIDHGMDQVVSRLASHEVNLTRALLHALVTSDDPTIDTGQRHA